jgi:hypothetical protein
MWDKSFAQSAPRNVMRWGLVPTADSNDPDIPIHSASSDPLQPDFGASYVSIQLASVVFDAIEGQPHQTFSLCHTVTHQHFDCLVAQILGNWGHPDYTCLYRLEVCGS